MLPPWENRKQIAEDTIGKSEAIVKITPGATLDSTFIRSQLPPLDPSKSPGHGPTPVHVYNDDAFAIARDIIKARSDAKVGVLNLASDEVPGGGWTDSLSTTQEEALCYSSTLYATLKEEYYPWPNLGPGCDAGVFSPGVVVHRDKLLNGLTMLPVAQRVVVSVITVAAPRFPPLTEDGESFADEQHLDQLREKIRLVYRMAAHNGQDAIVLGAMGCGAYGCPPKLVSKEMREVLQTPEFKGWFKEIEFAVFSSPRNGPGNFGVFDAEFKDVDV